jgi:hypothetical protein
VASSTIDLSHDKTELAALRWAIPILRAHCAEVPQPANAGGLAVDEVEDDEERTS